MQEQAALDEKRALETVFVAMQDAAAVLAAQREAEEHLARVTAEWVAQKKAAIAAARQEAAELRALLAAKQRATFQLEAHKRRTKRGVGGLKDPAMEQQFQAWRKANPALAETPPPEVKTDAAEEAASKKLHEDIVLFSSAEMF